MPYRLSRFLSEQGIIEWNWSDKIVRVFLASNKQWQEYHEPPGKIESGYIQAETMYIQEMEHFLKSIRGETSYMYTFDEDKQILEILSAAEHSYEVGQHIALNQGG